MNSYFNIRQFIKRTPTFFKVLNNFRHYIIGVDSIGIRTFNPSECHNVCKSNRYEKQNAIYNYPRFNAQGTYYYNSGRGLVTDIPRVHISSYNPIIYDKNFTDIVDRELAYHYIDHKENIESMHYSTYENVHAKNQYLAWLLCFRGDIDHISFRVNDIFRVVELCRKIKIDLNEENGDIKTSKDELLLQSSTKADCVPFMFKNTTEMIPYGYIEFIERRSTNEFGVREGFDEYNYESLLNSTCKNKYISN